MRFRLNFVLPLAATLLGLLEAVLGMRKRDAYIEKYFHESTVSKVQQVAVEISNRQFQFGSHYDGRFSEKILSYDERRIRLTTHANLPVDYE